MSEKLSSMDPRRYIHFHQVHIERKSKTRTPRRVKHQEHHIYEKGHQPKRTGAHEITSTENWAKGPN